MSQITQKCTTNDITCTAYNDFENEGRKNMKPFWKGWKSRIYRGYYTVARRYMHFMFEWQEQYLTSERSKRAKLLISGSHFNSTAGIKITL